jgi:hypothetical protein
MGKQPSGSSRLFLFKSNAEFGVRRQNDSMKTTTIIIVLLICLIGVPFILNLFIGFEHPHNIEVVGGETDWLNFFGGYLGSILGVIGALLICFGTMNHDRKRMELDFRHREIIEIQKEIANRLEQFSPEEILLASLFENPPSPAVAAKEMDRLQALHCRCEKLFNSAACLYYDPKNESSRNFAEEYKAMLFSAQETIHKLLTALQDKNKNNWKQNVIEINSEVERLRIDNEKVIKYAYIFIRSLIDEFNKTQWEENKNSIF